MVSRAAGGSSRSLGPGGLCLWAGRDEWVSQLLPHKGHVGLSPPRAEAAVPFLPP